MANDNAFGADVPAYSAASGVIDVDNANEQLPDVACGIVMFQADQSNSGDVYLVTAADQTTAGIRLAAGDTTPWLPLTNLNVLYAYGTAANQNLRYLVLR